MDRTSAAAGPSGNNLNDDGIDLSALMENLCGPETTTTTSADPKGKGKASTTTSASPMGPKPIVKVEEGSSLPRGPRPPKDTPQGRFRRAVLNYQGTGAPIAVPSRREEGRLSPPPGISRGATNVGNTDVTITGSRPVARPSAGPAAGPAALASGGPPPNAPTGPAAASRAIKREHSVDRRALARSNNAFARARRGTSAHRRGRQTPAGRGYRFSPDRSFRSRFGPKGGVPYVNAAKLSGLCQKHGFNPVFETKERPFGLCRVTIRLRDLVVEDDAPVDRMFMEARDIVAGKALKIVESWGPPAPRERRAPRETSENDDVEMIDREDGEVMASEQPGRSAATAAGTATSAAPASAPADKEAKIRKLVDELTQTLGKPIPEEVRSDPAKLAAWSAGFKFNLSAATSKTAAKAANQEQPERAHSDDRRRDDRRRDHSRRRDDDHHRGDYRRRSRSPTRDRHSGTSYRARCPQDCRCAACRGRGDYYSGRESRRA